jgi:hypothetical protein
MVQQEVAAPLSSVKEECYLVLVIHGVGDQYADNNFVTSLERCTEALARRVERQWRHLGDQLQNQLQSQHRTTAELFNWPSIHLRYIEWHSKLQYKHGWNHMVERVTPAGIEELRRVMRETFGDIALFMSPKWHQVILEEVVHELTVQYERFEAQAASETKRPSIRVALLCHSLGALIGFDLIRLGYQMPFQVEHVFLCGSSLGAYLSLLPDGERLAREYLLDLCVDRPSDDWFSAGAPHLYVPSGMKQKPLVLLENCSGAQDVVATSPEAVDAKTISSGPTHPCIRPRFYNLFHPLDPAAFRLEPWIDTSMVLQESVELPLAVQQEQEERVAPKTKASEQVLSSRPQTWSQAVPARYQRKQKCDPSCSMMDLPHDKDVFEWDEMAPEQSSSSLSSIGSVGRTYSRRSLSSPRLVQLGKEGNSRDDPFATTGFGAALRGKTAIGLSRSCSNPEFTVPLSGPEFEASASDPLSATIPSLAASPIVDCNSRSLSTKRSRHALQSTATPCSRSLGAGCDGWEDKVKVPEHAMRAAVESLGSVSVPKRSYSQMNCKNSVHRKKTPTLYFRRVDYVVHDPQVARSGRVWQFVQCLRSHACYWTSDEVASFVVGILCNCLRQPCARLSEPPVPTDVDLESVAAFQRDGAERHCSRSLPTVGYLDGRARTVSDSIAASEALVADVMSSAEASLLPEHSLISSKRWHTEIRALTPTETAAHTARLPTHSEPVVDARIQSDGRDSPRQRDTVKTRTPSEHHLVRNETGVSHERRGSPSLGKAPKHHKGQFRLLQKASSMSPAPTVGLLVGDSAPRLLRIFSDLLERLVTEGRWVTALFLVSGAFMITCGLVATLLLLVLRGIFLMLFYQHQRLSVFGSPAA